MKLTDVLVFKSPTRINWAATEYRIVRQVVIDYPIDYPPSALAMIATDRIKLVRRKVRRYTTYHWYLATLNFDRFNPPPFVRVQTARMRGQ